MDKKERTEKFIKEATHLLKTLGQISVSQFDNVSVLPKNSYRRRGAMNRLIYIRTNNRDLPELQAFLIGYSIPLDLPKGYCEMKKFAKDSSEGSEFQTSLEGV